MNYCLPLRYATMGGYLDPEAFWRLTVVNLQDLGTSLTVNLGTSSQDVFAARGGRARPGRLDQAEEEVWDTLHARVLHELLNANAVRKLHGDVWHEFPRGV